VYLLVNFFNLKKTGETCANIEITNTNFNQTHKTRSKHGSSGE